MASRKSVVVANLMGWFVSPTFGVEHMFNGMDLVAEIVAAWVDNDGKVIVHFLDKDGKNRSLALDYLRLFKTKEYADQYAAKLSELRAMQKEVINLIATAKNQSERNVYMDRLKNVEDKLRSL